MRVLLLDDTGRLLYRLDGAHFVVGQHDAHQRGVLAHRPLQLRQVDEPFAVHGQVGDAEPFLLQPFGGVEDGVVLDGGGDDVAAPPAAPVRHAAQR